MMRQKVDAQAIVSRANLRAMIEMDLGPADRSHKWRCPFHDDHNPSLGLDRDGRRFRCWSGRCGQRGTAADWVMLRENVDFMGALRILDPYSFEGEPASPRAQRYRDLPPPPPAPEPKPEAWLDPAWQAAADGLVVLAERNYWSPAGAAFRAYMATRGIDDVTARRFRLGCFLEDVWSEPLEILAREGRPRKIMACRGISIPWVAPGAWYSPTEAPDVPRWCGVNVRRCGATPFDPPEGHGKRYSAFAGSGRGFAYPHADLLDSQIGPPAMLVEGELDALLGTQEAGHVVHAVSVGGATQTELRPETADLLGVCPWWLIAVDHDEAAVKSVGRWRQLAPHKARRVMLPHGKDLSEYRAEGGDVRAWIADELAFNGID
jgi:hypothetical protein